MREAAVAALTKHGAVDLFAAREATRRELATLNREVATASGAVAWWERGAAPGPVDATALAKLRAKVGALESADAVQLASLHAALDAAAAEVPPLEVVRRVTACIGSARGAFGPLSRQDAALATALDELADRVFAIWAPDLVTDDAAAELVDPARAAAAAVHDPGPPRADERLVWAPASHREIVVRAARSLRGPGFDAARARVSREHVEHEAVTARLREVRKAQSLLHRLVAHDDDARKAELEATQRADQEHHELTAAWETLHATVSDALAAIPPLHVARAAIAAAGVIRARLTTWEISIGAKGPGLAGFLRGPSLRGRALLFAALAELRRATEAAFPGFLELLTPHGVAEAAREAAARGTPYRAAPDGDASRVEPRGADLVATVIARARDAGLDSQVSALVAHGGALGGIERAALRAARKRGLFDRAAAWATSAEEPVEARAAWHRAVAFAMLDGAEAIVARARHGYFALDFRAASCAAAAQFFGLGASMEAGLVPTCSLRGVAQTLDALRAARSFLVRVWGDPGDRLVLARNVASYIRATNAGPGPFPPGTSPRALAYDELVALLGEVLRPTTFADAAARADAASRGHIAAVAEAAAADERVTFWDQLSFFTDSDAEKVKKAQEKLGAELHASGQAAFAEVNRLLEQALTRYPPAIVLYRLDEAAWYVGAITVVRVHVMPKVWEKSLGHWTCELRGNVQAQHAFDCFAAAALQAFGAMPSDSEILAQHWERALDAPP